MGLLRSKVRDLLYDLTSGRIGDEEFKEGIKEILREYHDMKLIYQDIWLAATGFFTNRYGKEKERVEKLLDEVDPRFRSHFQRWADAWTGSAPTSSSEEGREQK